MIEIKPLGYHLGPDKHVDLLLFKSIDDLLMAVLTAGCVEIHAPDVCLRKDNGELFFDLFCPEAMHQNPAAAAFGTYCRHMCVVAAIMAAHVVGIFMIGK